MKITIIGSGNLATHLSVALKAAGNTIMHVYSRNSDNARCLADKLGCDATDDISMIPGDAEMYIIAINDDAIRGIAERLCHGRTDAVFVHTAGSVDINVFDGLALRHGVLWPIQTLSKLADVDFRNIPCCIEASDTDTLDTIMDMAKGITDTVCIVDSAKRKRMHLAAVFANNLTNHCYRLAEKIAADAGADFSLFIPLIEETARKVTRLSPHEAQTGPMVRYDQNVMARQLSLISDERTKAIYRLMAESIHEDSLGMHNA